MLMIIRMINDLVTPRMANPTLTRNPMNILRPTASLLAVFGLSASLTAQTLMLDFGPTEASGASLTNSPYHTVNTGFTDSYWNTVQADAGSLFWSQNVAGNAPASGIAVDLGATSTNSAADKVLNLANTPTSSALGTTISGGIYGGTSVGTDGIFIGGSTETRGVGMQITGLTTGDYTVYIMARNTNSSATYNQDVYASVGAAAGSFNFTAYEKQTLAYSGTTATASWSAGVNYAVFSVSITSGEVLNLAAMGAGGQNRGFINAVQIVNTSTIPEPSTYAAIFGGLALAGVATVRRRR